MYNSTFLATLTLLTVVGWIINLATLAAANTITGFQIVQAIGILAFPIGVVTGYTSLFI
jgi:hypothetical protein